MGATWRVTRGVVALAVLAIAIVPPSVDAGSRVPQVGVASPLGRLSRLSVGGEVTCGVSRLGKVKCWGRAVRDVLGEGHLVSANEVGVVEPSLAPLLDLGAGRSALAVSSGWDHTCVLLDDHSIVCTGSNQFGQLGTKVESSVRRSIGESRRVPLGRGRTALSVVADTVNTCALLDDRTVRCWGNAAGPVGSVFSDYDNAIGLGEYPTAYPVVDLGSMRPVAIDLSNTHACALSRNGKLRCWGSSGFGAVGYNANIGGQNAQPPSAFPMLSFRRPVVDVELGNDVTCVLLDNGEVRCFGSNGVGVLGTGTKAEITWPAQTRPIDFGGGRRAVQISVGFDHACALLDDGHVKCWGYGTFGRLGQGNKRSVGRNSVPADVPDVRLPAGLVPARVTAGTYSTCVVFTAGSSTCWGSNSAGELGLGHLRDIGDGPGEMGNALELHTM